MLGVTADNTTANDTMIDELQKLVKSFPGQKMRSRCFLHIVNLVAKALLRQFEPKKKKKKDSTHNEED
ncbi:hypothetical protein FOMPIDRAFT_1102388, partial [Fomitopsis schrenkii]